MAFNLEGKLRETEEAIAATKKAIGEWDYKSQGTMGYFKAKQETQKQMHDLEREDRFHTIRAVWGPQAEAGHCLYELSIDKDIFGRKVINFKDIDHSYSSVNIDRFAKTILEDEFESQYTDIYGALTQFNKNKPDSTFVVEAGLGLMTQIRLLSEEEIAKINSGQDLMRKTILRHRKEEEELSRGLDWLRARDSRVSWDYKNEMESLERQAAILKEAVGINQDEPDIRRGRFSPAYNRGFYSLFAEGSQSSPIFLYSGKTLQYLFTTRKDRPLRIKIIETGSVMRQRELERACATTGLKEGEFCNSEGCPLVGENAEIASRIFTHVMNGVEVLPDPKEPAGYAVRGKKGKGGGESLKPREWGQSHLENLGPMAVTDGELFGSGMSYKIYDFRGLVVAEANREGRGTYCFEESAFEHLRHKSRIHLIRKRPAGFLGRVTHKGRQEDWKSKIKDCLTRSF